MHFYTRYLSVPLFPSHLTQEALKEPLSKSRVKSAYWLSVKVIVNINAWLGMRQVLLFRIFSKYSKHFYSSILNPYQFLCEWGNMCLNQYGVSNVRFKGMHVRPLYTHVFVFFESTCSCVIIIPILHLLVKTMYFTHVWRHVIIVKLGLQRATPPYIDLCTEHNINLSPEAKASQHTSGNIWICAATYTGHFLFTGLLLVLTSYWQRRPLFEHSLSLGKTGGWSIREGVQRKRIWKLSMRCVHRW